MRIVFMGTPDFAVASLSAIVDQGHNVVGVVTAPDKRGGRGMKDIITSPVKKYAATNNIECLQPEKLRNPVFLNALKELNADLFIVVAFRMLPEIVWSMPHLGTINLHGSLLPAYRGAAPINWAIINGEPTTGVTTFFITHEIDTGALLLQEKIDITPEDNAGSLHDKMKIVGAKLILKTISKIESNEIGGIPQSGTISHAPKLYYDSCKIDWTKTAKQCHDFIRGLSPYPGAFTNFQDKQLKIFDSNIIQDFITSTNENFFWDNSNKLYFKASDNWIEVLMLQAEGKRKMNDNEYVNGLRSGR